MNVCICVCGYAGICMCLAVVYKLAYSWIFYKYMQEIIKYSLFLESKTTSWKKMDFCFHFPTALWIALNFLFINMYHCYTQEQGLLFWFGFGFEETRSTALMQRLENKATYEIELSSVTTANAHKTRQCESLPVRGIMETVLSWHTKRQSQPPTMEGV